MEVGDGGYAFPPYMPDNEESLQDDSSAASLTIARSELLRLLQENAHDFWHVVRRNTSLTASLDSYLQYARRAHDAGPLASGPPSIAEQELARSTFMVFLRMVTPDQDGIKDTDQAALLYNSWLLDVPKLMDIAVLFGHENSKLVQDFMHKVFALQPQYGNDLAAMAPALARNLRDVCQTSQQAAERLASNSQASSLSALSDGAAYLHDTTRTLAAFLESYPPASATLAGGGGSGILAGLPPLHDELLRLISAAVASFTASQASALGSDDSQLAISQVRHHMRGLADGLPHLAYLLIVNGLLGGYSQTGSAVNQHSQTPAQRGQQLMDSLSSVELPSGPGSAQASLLCVTARQFHLSAAVQDALAQGKIVLDKVQQEYLFVQLGERPPAPSNAGSIHSRISPIGHPGIAQQPQQQHLDDSIAQILEVLPGYGRGFLAACLDASDDDPRQVIHQLLEGSLPKHLGKMDPHLTHWQRPQAGAASQRASAQPPTQESDLSWGSILDQQPSAPSTSAPPTSHPASRLAAHKGTAKALALPAADRKAVHAHANAAQWHDEYDDEYDDSFDDLGAVNLDGRTEVEGGDDDELWPGAGSRPGPSRQQGAAPSATNSLEPQPGPGRPRGKGTRLWVLDGRIYNYRKEGATEVGGQAQAQQLVQEAQAVAQQIHGLGPGGNVPQQRAPSPSSNDGGVPGRKGPQQRQSAADPARDAGKDRRAHARKDKNKAAVGNHHRKDRAMRKMAGSPG